VADLQAGKRYAQAAFGIALESGTIAAWRAALDDVASVLAESDVAGAFADGRIPIERRLAMVERSLDVPPLALNLAKLLVSKGRSADARAVADAFGRMADEQEGIVHASITAAVDLSPQQVASIEQRLSSSLGKKVQVTSAVEPGIVGGLVVRVGDRMVDGSVRTRLKRLRRELEGAR
jgi:F-type H+-transporting ATPase subunit delta